MGLFGLFGRSPEQQLARAIAKRGVAARANIEEMRALGAASADGVTEYEFRLGFEAGGRLVRAVVRQRFNSVTATGLAAGEPASIMYDRDAPERLVILGAAKYRMAAPGVPVRIED